MQRRRKKLHSLMAWNLLVWICVAHLSRGIVSAQISSSAPSDQQAQVEKGRQVVAQVCAACHTTILRMVQVHKLSAEEWKDTVYFMISRGAQIMPDEVEPVTAYLVATAGSNRQTVTQTASVGRPGPGRADAQTPQGEGRAVFQQTCQQCHELATASTKLPSEEWSAVIARMINYGAKLTSGDQQKLNGYLTGLAK